MSANAVTTLRRLLSESYVVLVKTHNYHWNVEGPQFVSLHTLFEQQYTELFTAIDEIAERLRALGSFAPGTFAEFLKIGNLKEGTATDATDMAADLANDHLAIAKFLRAAIAAGLDDDSTEDLCIGRVTLHEKTAWMLNAIIKRSGLNTPQTSLNPAGATKPAAKPAAKETTKEAVKEPAKTAPKEAPKADKPAKPKAKKATG